MKKISSIIFALVLFVLAAHGQSADIRKETAPKETTPVVQVPLSYGIVTDNSGSYRTILEEVINSVKTIVEANDSDDEAFLVRFVDSNKITLLQDFSSSKEELQSAAEDMFIEGGQTAILDAVHFSAKHLASNETAGQNKRKLLILITDGEDRKSATKLDEALKFLKEEKIQVYTLGFSDGKIYKNLLEKLAKETGGKSFIAEKRSDIKTAVKQLTTALRSQ
ncbi:MAG TPA: VWA domain-containing protein [Pyrinomonadaceae bacterium]|nr:VWA domain-containing protein [Pyrinomonadaceae bacterium]